MSSVDFSSLKTFAEKYGVSLTEDNLASLEAFYRLVTETNKSLNLTAITDEEAFIARHFADSLFASPLLKKGDFVCDVGTGAGFPSVPLAVVRPDVNFTALDSTAKKTAFVKYAANALSLANLSVETGRAEECDFLFGKFDCVCARAVTALSPLTEICFPLLKTGGVLFAYKTETEDLSVCENALKILHGRVDGVLPYILPDGSSRVLYFLRKLAPAPKGYPRRWGQIKNRPL